MSQSYKAGITNAQSAYNARAAEAARQIQVSFKISPDLLNSIRLINDVQYRLSTELPSSILQAMQPAIININQISKQINQMQKVFNNPGFITAVGQIQKSIGAYQSVFYDNISKQFSEMVDIQNQLRTVLSRIDLDNLNRMAICNTLHVTDSLGICIDETITLDTSFNYADPQLIHDVVKEVLEQTGILSNQQHIEESVNALIASFKDSNSVKRQIIIMVLNWFISFILGFALLHQPSALWDMSVKGTNQLVRTVQKQSEQILREYQITPSMIKPYKFISKESLPIWSKRTSHSEVLHKCHFGDMAIVIKKKRNWTQVVVFYDDNSTVKGWTYSRYLEKPLRK